MAYLKMASLLTAAAMSTFLPSVEAAAAVEPTAIKERCAFTVVGVKLECGQLQVKLDRKDQNSSKSLRLSYVILKSRSPKPAADPLVFLTGGPGSSSLYFLNILSKSSNLENRDMIAIEQRGNGYSEPNLLCKVDEAVDVASTRKAWRKCFEEVKSRNLPLSAYNLSEAAQDLVDLRRALKISEWNIFGTSYGSFWALQYLALKPEGVRSVVLDSPYPPQADPRDSWVAHLNGLSAIFSACVDDQGCNRAYPDLRNRFVKLISNAIAEGGSPAAGGQLIGFVNGINFETATVALVPRLIDAYERKDQKTVMKIASLDPYGTTKGFDIRRASSTGLYMNTTCIEDAPFQSAAENRIKLTEQWPEDIIAAAKFTDNTVFDYCNGVWEVEKGSAAYNEPVSSTVPALITVGALDPETPPLLGVIMKRTLPNATLAILPDSGHAAISRPSACTVSLLRKFLDTPTSALDVSCLTANKPRFSLPGQPIQMIKIGR
jgi:pimeloyl-ACP methyl ester carboxylesterase